MSLLHINNKSISYHIIIEDYCRIIYVWYITPCIIYRYLRYLINGRCIKDHQTYTISISSSISYHLQLPLLHTFNPPFRTADPWLRSLRSPGWWNPAMCPSVPSRPGVRAKSYYEWLCFPIFYIYILIYIYIISLSLSLALSIQV